MIEDGEQVRHEAGLVVRIAAGAAAGALVAVPFVLILAMVVAQSPWLVRLDHGVANTLNAWALRHPSVVTALEVVERVAHPWSFRLAVLFVAALLWRAGSRRLATWAVTTMAVGGLLNLVVKAAVARARPSFDDAVASADFYSFPSGHAQNSMLGVAVLLLVLLPVLDRGGRTVAWATGVLLVLVTGLDRVLLGVHYLSDVVAGWVVALAVVAGTAVAFGTPHRRHRDAGLDPASSRRLRLGPAARGEAAAAPAGIPGLLRELRALLARLLLGTAAIWAVLVATGLLVLALDDVVWPLTLEEPLLQRLAALRTPTWTSVMEAVSWTADTTRVLILLALVAVLLRLSLGRWREPAFVIAAVSVEALAFVLTTAVVDRARPEVMITSSPPTSSFPSGHLAAALALYLSLALVLSSRAPTAPRRVIVWVLFLLPPLAVAASRVYLGAHYPSDYLGSVLGAALAITLAARLVLFADLPPQLHGVLDSSFRRRHAPLGPETTSAGGPPVTSR